MRLSFMKICCVTATNICLQLSIPIETELMLCSFAVSFLAFLLCLFGSFLCFALYLSVMYSILAVLLGSLADVLCIAISLLCSLFHFRFVALYGFAHFLSIAQPALCAVFFTFASSHLKSPSIFFSTVQILAFAVGVFLLVFVVCACTVVALNAITAINDNAILGVMDIW